MPLVQCHIPLGLTTIEKRKLIHEIALVVQSTLAVDPAAVRVILDEHDTTGARYVGDASAGPEPLSAEE